MSEDKQDEGCGNPNCTNCSDESGKGWEKGMDDTFDKAFDATSKMVAKGEMPIGICVFIVSDKGTLAIETAGAGPVPMMELILSEVALQVSDHLQSRAAQTPGIQELMEKLASEAPASKL